MIELLVVLLIFSLAIFAVPSWFRSLTKIKVRETAKLFVAFIRYLELQSLDSGEDIIVVIDSGCSIKAFKGGVLIAKFKKPKGVDCCVLDEVEISGAKLFVSQGYVQPLKVKFFKDKISYTVDTAKISVWGDGGSRQD